MFKKTIVFALLSIIPVSPCELKIESDNYVIISSLKKFTFQCTRIIGVKHLQGMPKFKSIKCKDKDYFYKSGEEMFNVDENKIISSKQSWKIDNFVCLRLNFDMGTINVLCDGKYVYPEYNDYQATDDRQTVIDKTEKIPIDICNKTLTGNLIV